MLVLRPIVRPMFRRTATAALALLAAAGSFGGSCQVSYCSEDCDPCVQPCKCRSTCRHGLAYDFEEVHRLSTYRLEESIDGSGRRGRSISGILGLSLDLAQGPGDHSTADFTRFSRGVLDVNTRLLSPEGESWTPGPVEVFETALVVPFRDESAGASLDLLFDRHGHLVEIQQSPDLDR